MTENHDLNLRSCNSSDRRARRTLALGCLLSTVLVVGPASAAHAGLFAQVATEIRFQAPDGGDRPGNQLSVDIAVDNSDIRPISLVDLSASVAIDNPNIRPISLADLTASVAIDNPNLQPAK